MGLPAHRFLEEFALDVAAFPAAITGLRQHHQPRQQTRSEVAVDHVAISIQQAYSQGYAAGEEAERAAGDARVAELGADLERKLAEAQRQFGLDLADRIDREMAAGLTRARERLASQIGTVLMAVMRRRLAEDCILDLADQAARILEAEDSIVVDLRGPAKFVEIVMAAIEARHRDEAPSMLSRIRCHTSESSELSLEYADSVIEARLAEWLGRLDEVRTP